MLGLLERDDVMFATLRMDDGAFIVTSSAPWRCIHLLDFSKGKLGFKKFMIFILL